MYSVYVDSGTGHCHAGLGQCITAWTNVESSAALTRTCVHVDHGTRHMLGWNSALQHGSVLNHPLDWYWEHGLIICVPAWLNEALCSETDFILSYRQKYEPRSKFVIFDIFFLNLHHYKHNHDKYFIQWKKCGRKEVLWNIFFLIDPLEVHTNYHLWQAKSLWSYFEWYHTWRCSTFRNFW